MFALTLLTALAAPGHLPVWYCDSWWGYGFAGYAHGYGLFRPIEGDAGGVVLPPSWPCDPTPAWAHKAWYDYVMQLETAEREDMIRVWMKATPEARKRLLCKIAPMELEAARHRLEEERERAIARFKVENRPMEEGEIAAFEAYYGRLRGLARKEARYKWLLTNNRGRRLYLKEVLRQEELKELLREDEKDMQDEIELQKELVQKAREDQAKREAEEKHKKAKEEKDKKDKEKKDKEKKDKEEKDKKDKEEKDKKDKEEKDKKDKEEKDKKDNAP